MDVYGGPHPVMFSFEANKHYSSVCLEVDCGATLHVATDNESPFKRYHLVDMTIDGVTSGTIDLAFPPQPAMGEDPNDPPWVPPSGTTVLQKVMIDESGNRLRFDLVSYLYDPPTIAHYELWRCP